MRQKSWQEGQIHAFEEFGGVPRMWVPDNAATATDRAAAPRVTLVNREYERFAEHYGAAVLPARSVGRATRAWPNRASTWLSAGSSGRPAR